MNWNNFLTYGNNNDVAFEMLCNQLFESYLKRTYGDELVKFRVVNGAAGDGGIEAYGILKEGSILAVQAKWFRATLTRTQFKQIEESINTALALRPEIAEYIICIPRDLSSLKFVRGKKGEPKQPAKEHEDKLVDAFTKEMLEKHPKLKITWWFDHDLDFEIAQSGNEGMYKFWFEKEVVSLEYLKELFELSRIGWLEERYIPELHAQGVIHKSIQELSFSQEFRNGFKADLAEFKDLLNQIIKRIQTFIKNKASVSIEQDLLTNFILHLEKEIEDLNAMIDALDMGNDLYEVEGQNSYDVAGILSKLKRIVPLNGQNGVVSDLIDVIVKYTDFKEQEIESFFSATMRLILGDPGTGKTHGLTNAVDIHIKKGFPAIIIQAKGAKSNDWTSLLSSSLSLPGWTKDQMLSAFQALAIQSDHKRATNKSDPDFEHTKILICIDGLEEDFGKEGIWYARMREAEVFIRTYPRLKFVFSARSYFYQKTKIPKGKGFATVFLPREGDVPVWSVAEEYFSEEHFNIRIDSFTKVRGIDSLFALRLFCEEYQGQTIEKEEDILTATMDLLEKKIDRIEETFKSMSEQQFSQGRTPVRDSLEAVSDAFCTKNELDHTELSNALKPNVGEYLPSFEFLIDFLVNNGMLIRSEVFDQGLGLKKKRSVYRMLSNSVIEMIIAGRLANDISNGKIANIPTEFKNICQELEGEETISAQLIVQSTVDRLFISQKKLIGDDGFLTDGVEQDKISSLRLKALVNAKGEQVEKYKAEVEELLLSPGENQFNVLTNLILPASRFNGNPFGGLFLHKVLGEQRSTFERDKKWSGLDHHEEFISKNKDWQLFSVKQALIGFAGEHLDLSPYSLHDETPLIFGWALSNIDQDLRSRLRVSLTVWALKQPEEFEKLLDILFPENDPQIQEDLASIMLALAGNLKDTISIERLARWSLNNVFDNIAEHRNVIVRQGMRGIVERAYGLGLLNSSEVEASRPGQIVNDVLIPLDSDALEDGSEQLYPIESDLAWYVIKKAYNKFLDYEDTDEAVEFLNRFSLENDSVELYPHVWGMAAAIAYIKNLGFNRITGNSFTDDTHGSKSKVYTYEEKYTWLAVHYLQGYLSDNLPPADLAENVVISDYSLLTPIPNPAESKYFRLRAGVQRNPPRWIINGPLVNEKKDHEQIDDFIKESIESEPDLNFCDWIDFNENDFSLKGDKKMLALYNRTKVHDLQDLYMGLLTVRATFVKKGSMDGLSQSKDELYFVENLDGLEAHPETHTYSNPTDLVWMDWIGEIESEDYFINIDGVEEVVFKSITKVTTDDSSEGEQSVQIPSKAIRKLVGIVHLADGMFTDRDGKVIGIQQEIKDNKGNYQELLVIDKERLLASLAMEGLEMIWFAEFLQHTNYSNKTLKEVPNYQKVRKYLVKYNGNEFEVQKFWDATYTNKR
ncbi:hypothetical protein [Chryseobacterium gambrini]|uniref:hypothetical protein n=1 Tax=Chryseobacterium gambrini TaxID=373672 RepID=UPI003D0E1C73